MMSFDEVSSRRMHINTRYVAYNVWKEGFFIVGMCMLDNRWKITCVIL